MLGNELMGGKVRNIGRQIFQVRRASRLAVIVSGALLVATMIAPSIVSASTYGQAPTLQIRGRSGSPGDPCTTHPGSEPCLPDQTPGDGEPHPGHSPSEVCVGNQDDRLDDGRKCVASLTQALKLVADKGTIILKQSISYQTPRINKSVTIRAQDSRASIDSDSNACLEVRAGAAARTTVVLEDFDIATCVTVNNAYLTLTNMTVAARDGLKPAIEVVAGDLTFLSSFLKGSGKQGIGLQIDERGSATININKTKRNVRIFGFDTGIAVSGSLALQSGLVTDNSTGVKLSLAGENPHGGSGSAQIGGAVTIAKNGTGVIVEADSNGNVSIEKARFIANSTGIELRATSPGAGFEEPAYNVANSDFSSEPIDLRIVAPGPNRLDFPATGNTKNGRAIDNDRNPLSCDLGGKPTGALKEICRKPGYRSYGLQTSVPEPKISDDLLALPTLDAN